MDSTYVAIDYIVFFAFIVFSFIIPLWGKFRTRKKETKADYVFATGSVSMGAMMLSIARGTLGVRSFLGYPSELYYKGSAMWETLYGMLLAYPVVCYVFVPVYYSLGITSIYQYLDMRFKSKTVRCLASFSYVIRSLLNLAVTVFTPCVALNTVIGIPYWASITGITFISMFFTLMGGLKAAILSDVLQGLTMIGVSLVIIVHGTVDVGGVSTVYNVTKERGRLEFFNFDLDPTIRVSTISATIGQLFMSLSIFGCQQNFVQRYFSMSSRSKVVKTMLANIPVISILFSLSWIVGMVIFAKYADCDPLSINLISKYDEIVPFFVEDKFHHMPGLLGLVMATLFNSALTIAVSNLNSLSTVTFEDFICLIPSLSNLSDKQQLFLIKLIGVFYSFIIIFASFLVGMLSGVIESSMLMTSATAGPLLGVFILAMLVPCANWKGASAGMVFSHITTLWLTFGRLSLDIPEESLPLSTSSCSNSSFANDIWDPNEVSRLIRLHHESQSSITPRTMGAEDDSFSLYAVTYMYYAFIGSVSTVVVGIIVSLLTADPAEDAYEEHLLHPFILKMSKSLPGTPRIFCKNPGLGSSNLACSVSSIASFSGKVCPVNGTSEDGKPKADLCYVRKLEALKQASLEVTNEVTKGTRL